MKFDVIIATYNRKESLQTLIEDILSTNRLPENIIVVDSSDIENEDIKKVDKVFYIHTERKNQPYQRYLGYLNSTSEILVYFDDDMRVVDRRCFEKILEAYSDKVVAVQPDFVYDHTFLDTKTPKSNIRDIAKKNFFFRFLKSLSGNPQIEDGKFWYAGLRGKMPKDREYIEYFRGPVFSVRREVIYKGFNYTLFDLYDKKLGKAEDAVLGYTVSRVGKILYLKEELFLHDDQDDSTYSINLINYNKRVAYSRLYLSLEYARGAKQPKIVAFIVFSWYIWGRVLTTLVNQIIKPKQSRWDMCKGYILGYMKAIQDIKLLQKVKNSIDQEVFYK